MYLKCMEKSSYVQCSSNEINGCNGITGATSSTMPFHNNTESIVRNDELSNRKKHRDLCRGHAETYIDVSSLPAVKIENLDESSSLFDNIVEEQEANATKASSSVALDEKRKYQCVATKSSSSIALDKKMKYQCEMCKYSTIHRNIYIKHNWYMHNENLSGNALPIYRCEKCTYETKNKGHINRHFREKRGCSVKYMTVINIPKIKETQ